jgi:hypothetical protein
MKTGCAAAVFELNKRWFRVNCLTTLPRTTSFFIMFILIVLTTERAIATESSSYSLSTQRGCNCALPQRHFSERDTLDWYTNSVANKHLTTSFDPSTGIPIWTLRGGSLQTSPEKKPNLRKIIVRLQRNKSDVRPKDDPHLLVLIRFLFFAYYASLGSLLPYLPVYYHSLGHGGQIIGMLGAIKPFTTFLVAPLWGIISDSSRNPFTVLYFTFLVSLVGQLLVAFRHDPPWIMSMVFITAFFNAPVKSLLDSIVMSNLKDRSRYGRMRLWGQLGFGVGSSGVGILLTLSKHRPYTPPVKGTSMLDHLEEVWQSITGYKLLFLSYALLSIPTFICIQAFDKWTKEHSYDSDAETKPLSKKQTMTTSKSKNMQPMKKEKNGKSSVWDGIKLLFNNADALLFFFLVLVVGVSSGVIENFAYVRIREVGGTGKEMGLSRLVSSMAGAPMFWFSGPLTELLGADRVIILSLMSYVVRYFNYALMQSPLQGLPAEALRGVTFAAFWSTCTIYASRISPQGMQATMVSETLFCGLSQNKSRGCPLFSMVMLLF